MRKDIKGYEGKYAVDDDGSIISVRRNIKLKPYTNDARGGYLMVILWKNSNAKGMYVHRLVAEAFVDNPHGWQQVHHKDGDKTNNAASNLVWFNKFTKKYSNGKEEQV